MEKITASIERANTIEALEIIVQQRRFFGQDISLKIGEIEQVKLTDTINLDTETVEDDDDFECVGDEDYHIGSSIRHGKYNHTQALKNAQPIELKKLYRLLNENLELRFLAERKIIALESRVSTRISAINNEFKYKPDYAKTRTVQNKLARY
jgi:hypothetical protein